jgi:hypothetical protein
VTRSALAVQAAVEAAKSVASMMKERRRTITGGLKTDIEFTPVNRSGSSFDHAADDRY